MQGPTFRIASWRRPLLRLLAVALLAAQTAGLVHAADLDAHAKGDLCHVCQHQDRSSAPPPVPVSSGAPEFVACDAVDDVRTEAPATFFALRPPTRAPPRFSIVR